MSRFLFIMAILLSACLPLVAQGKGWRGIVPLRSTRADVDLSTKVGNIDAAAINDYWAFIRRNPGTWRNGRHCADIVAEALSYAGVVLNNTQPGMSIPREVLYIIQRDARRYKREKMTPLWKSNFKSVLDLRRVYD